MKRRNFLQLSTAAAALSAISGKAAGPLVAERNAKGLRVGAQKDRYDQELMIMGGRFNLKVSSRDTGGDLCIYDTVRDSKGGPALHLHDAQDEWFYVLRGNFLVRVGDETFTIGPGDSAFAPRKVPHAFAMTSDGQGQMLVLFQPAGSMEEFFKEMAGFGSEIPKDQEIWKNLWAKHGMQMLGPPLKF